MRNSIAKGIAAIIVAGVLAAGICCTGFVSRGDNGKWFGNGNLSTWHWNDKTDDKAPDDKPNGDNDLNENIGESGSFLPAEVKGNGIRLMSAVITNEEFDEYGINAQADSAYTVTAIVEPEEATNKAVTYTAKFENASSSWANGKKVTDYVTVSQTSSGSLMATVTIKQAFGEPVMIVATSDEDSDISASFPVHYVKRIASVTSSVACAGTGTYSIGLGKDTSYTTAITMGTGTVQGTFEVSAKISFSDSYFWAPFKSNQYYTQGMNYSGYSGSITPKMGGWDLTLSKTDGSSGNFSLTDSRDFFTLNGGGNSQGVYERMNTALYQTTKGWTTSSSNAMGYIMFTIVNKYVDSKGAVQFTESKTSQALIKAIDMSAISVSVSSVSFPADTAIYG